MNPLRALYRLYLRHELKWILDARADEMEHNARHPAVIRSLDAEAAELRWRLGGRPSQQYGLQALRQRRV